MKINNLYIIPIGNIERKSQLCPKWNSKIILGVKFSYKDELPHSIIFHVICDDKILHKGKLKFVYYEIDNLIFYYNEVEHNIQMILEHATYMNEEGIQKIAQTLAYLLLRDSDFLKKHIPEIHRLWNFK